MRGRPESNERRQDREQDLGTRIVHPAPQAQHQGAHADSPYDFPGDDGREYSGCLAEREHSGAHGRNREAVQDQRRGVIGQALPFEDHQNSSRQLQPAGDGQGRHSVRRRNDRTQNEAHRPGQAQDPVRRRGHRDGREGDAPDRKQRDGAQIEAELSPAHRDRRRVDDRRQYQQQHQFRSELHRGQAGNQRQRDTRNNQQNGRRDLQPLRGDPNRRSHDQQQYQNLDFNDHHAWSSDREKLSRKSRDSARSARMTPPVWQRAQ